MPGVPNASTGRVDYDIPLALFDCRLDDGVTRHKDFHSGCDETHREWWGKTFFLHFPNKGFVGDLFTVNGTAYPVLHVKRRKYRFRFLDASIARIYDLKLMRGEAGGGSNLEVAKYLLKRGADPEHCLWAAAFDDDINDPRPRRSRMWTSPGVVGRQSCGHVRGQASVVLTTVALALEKYWRRRPSVHDGYVGGPHGEHHV